MIKLVFQILLLSICTLYTYAIETTGYLYLGCYDKSTAITCSQTVCSSNCQDCESETRCLSCEYGYFLYNTPEQTVECLPCPSYELMDINYKYECGTCLEMPETWQYTRVCKSRYLFPSGDFSQNVINVTSQNPILFYIKAEDPNHSRESYEYSGDKQTYYLEKTPDLCSGYEFLNYDPDEETEQEDIVARMKIFNDQKCNKCSQGRNWNNTLNECQTCEMWDEQCASCSVLGCNQCKEGYDLRTYYGGKKECVQCSQEAHCLTCDPWDEQWCYTCKDGYVLQIEEFWDDWQQMYVKEPNGQCLPQQKCSFSQDPTNTDIPNYFCGDCYRQLEEIGHATGDYSVYKNCFLCDIKLDENTWEFTFDCALKCPEGYGSDMNNNEQCTKCTDEGLDQNCAVCYINDSTEGTACYQCIEPYIWDTGLGECVTYTASAADVSGCSSVFYNTYFLSFIKNEDGQSIYNQAYEELYKNTKSICTLCDATQYPIPDWHFTEISRRWDVFQSIDVTGSLCMPVPMHCRYSLPYLNDNYYKSINPIYEKGHAINNPDTTSADQVQSTEVFWGNLGTCLVECETLNPADIEAGSSLFYDTEARRCTYCPDGLGGSGAQCRKKFGVSFYVQCTGQMDNVELPDDIMVRINQDYNEIYHLNESSFLSQFTDTATGEILIDRHFSEFQYAELDQDLYQYFEFNIYLMVSNDREGTECLSQFDFSYDDTEFTTNIPKKIFRTREAKISFNTINYENGKVNDRNAIIGFSNKRIKFTKFTTLEFNSITFQYPSGQIDKNTERTIIEFTQTMPGASLVLNNCEIYTYYTALTFQITDLAKLEINTFIFDSKKAFDGIIGFPLFDIKDEADYNKHLELHVNNMRLSSFVFNQNNIFNLPLRDAHVHMENITFQDCIFDNAYLLKDTYYGEEQPKKIIDIKNVNVNSTYFSQSSGLILLYSVSRFHMKGLTITNSQFFSELTEQIQSVIYANVLQLEDVVVKDNIFQNFTLLIQEKERMSVKFLDKQNKIENFVFENAQLSQPDYMLMIQLQTPIPMNIKNFLVKNITSVEATSGYYPKFLNFYTLTSTYKVYDKLVYITRKNPGHRPQKEVFFDDEDEGGGATEQIQFWCDFGYNEDGTCWEPMEGIVQDCFVDLENWEWIEDLNDVTSSHTCMDWFGNIVPYDAMPDGKVRQEPFSFEDPTIVYEPPPWLIEEVEANEGCPGEDGEFNSDIQWCLEFWAKQVILYGIEPPQDEGSNFEEDGSVHKQIPNSQVNHPNNANAMLSFMRVSYTRSSSQSKLNLENFEVQLLYDVNFLQVYDVDYVWVKNFTCGGNLNHTLFIPNCMEVQALSLEKTESFELFNSTIQYLYGSNRPIYINGPSKIQIESFKAYNIYLLKDQNLQSLLYIDQKYVQQQVNISHTWIQNVAIIDHKEEYAFNSAPAACIYSRNITLLNVTTDYTVSLYTTSGFYLQGINVNITNSKFLRSNWPIDSPQKEPVCSQIKIDRGEDVPDELLEYDDQGNKMYPSELPVNYTYYPRNNSCPFVNDFISNPDLPKSGGHESCKDYYMHKLTFKYFNILIVNGTKTLREYLSLGPKITSEGFIYVDNYKNLKVIGNTINKHVYASSTIRIKSEKKNGVTTITDNKISELFPNFRKENSGSAGAIYFSGTRNHNITIRSCKFMKTASRIKGGVFSFTTESADAQYINITEINIEDTYALQGGAFHIKGIDNEKTHISLLNITLNNTKKFMVQQSNTAKSFDDPLEDPLFDTSTVKWPVEDEWKRLNTTCENITKNYLIIKEKQREAEAKANEPKQAYANFELRGCYDQWGYLTDDINFCNNYYQANFQLHECYSNVQNNPTLIQDQQICETMYIYHSQFRITGNCYQNDGTYIEWDWGTCETYFQSPDFSGGCYDDDGNYNDNQAWCTAYYQYVDFWMSGGCNNLDGEWQHDPYQCELIYFKADFEKNGGCWNAGGMWNDDIGWCQAYYYGSPDDNNDGGGDDQPQPPDTVTGDIWEDWGCYEPGSTTNWIPDPYHCEELMMQGGGTAAGEMPDFWLDGGCPFGPDDEWIEEPEECERIWHEQHAPQGPPPGTATGEERRETTGNPVADGGCYDYEDNWHEDPQFCIDNGFASQEYLDQIQAEQENQDEEVVEEDSGDAAAELLSQFLVADQLLINSQQNQNLIYIEEGNCTVDRLVVHQSFNQSIIMTVHSYINITNSNITNSICSQYCKGTLNFVNSKFNLTNVLFSGNNNKEGGAVYAAGYYVSKKGVTEQNTILLCIFINNNSTKGGGLFLDGTSCDITKCQFKKNRASIRGGGVYSKLAIDTSASTDGETSRRRRRLASTTQTTQLTGTVISQNYGELGGGINYEGTDITFGSTSDRNLVSGNDANVKGNESSDIVAGCNYGEAQNTKGLCEKCPQGKYTVKINDANCRPCPSHAYCPGGSRIKVDPEYWRPNEFSDVISNCHNFPENCIGGYKAGDSLCVDGNIGALCEACDVEARHWPESYANSEEFRCSKCALVEGNVVKVFFINVWILITMVMSVKETINMIQQQIMKNTLTILLGINDIDFDEAGVLIKIFTNYFQIVSVLATFRLETPPGFITISNAVGNPVQQMGYSLDCFLFEFQQTMAFIYFRIMWQYVVNTGQILIFILGFLILRLAKKTPLTFGKIIFTTLIFMFINLQPSYVQQLMDLLSCREISKYFYMSANVAYECYTDEYYAYLLAFLIPSLFVFMILIPVILFIGLKRAHDRGDMKKIAIRFKYGFLYNEYADQSYFWEFVKIAQKIFITIIISYYEEHIIVKGTLVFLIVMAYGSLSQKYTPYFRKNLNNLDMQSTFICSVSIVLGVFLYRNVFDYWIWIGYAIIGCLNIYFIVKMFHAIVHKYIADTQEKIIEKAKKLKFLKRFEDKKGQDRKIIVEHYKNRLKEHFQLYIQALKRKDVQPSYKIFLELQRKQGTVPQVGEFNDRPDATLIRQKQESEKEQKEEEFQRQKKIRETLLEQGDVENTPNSKSNTEDDKELVNLDNPTTNEKTSTGDNEIKSEEKKLNLDVVNINENTDLKVDNNLKDSTTPARSRAQSRSKKLNKRSYQLNTNDPQQDQQQVDTPIRSNPPLSTNQRRKKAGGFDSISNSEKSSGNNL